MTLPAEQAQSIAVDHRRPLPVDGRTWWRVETGELEVFDRGPSGDGAGGAPVHLYSVPAGAFLLRPEAGAWVTGLPGTMVSPSRGDELSAAIDADVGDGLREALEAGVAALFGGVADLSNVGHEAALLNADQTTTLADGQAAAAPQTVSWLRVVRGSCRLAGLADTPPLSASPAVIALAAPAVIVAEGPCELQLVDFGAQAGADIVAGLDQVVTALGPAATASAVAARARADSVITKRAGTEQRAGDDAARQLSRTLPHHRITVTEDIAGTGNYVAVALEAIGAALGVTLTVPTLPGATPRRLIAVTTAESRLRTQVVHLEAGWWKATAGPMIAFRSADHMPVAIVAPTSRRWEWVDPSTGLHHRVDQAFARSLDPVAVGFVRPLPPGRVRFRELAHLMYTVTRRSLWAAGIVGLLGSLMALVTPVATQILFGDVFPSGRTSLLFAVAGLVGGAGLASIVLDFTRNMASLRIGGTVESTLLPAAWDRLLRLPPSFFRRYQVGDLQSRLAGIITASTTLSTGIALVLAAVFSTVSFIVMYLYSPILTLVAAVGSLIFIGLLVPLTIVRVRRVLRVLDIQGKVKATEFQLLQSVPRLRVAGAEGRGLQAWARDESNEMSASWHIARITLLETIVATAVPSLMLAVIYLVAGGQKMNPGQFMGFTTALGLFSGAVASLYQDLDPLLRLRPLYQRIKPLLTEPVEDDDTTSDPGVLTGTLALDSVSFRYDEDGPVVLDDVSLEAHPGEFIAVVGPSGSGKSTIVRMLLGFELPESGQVLYDGKDLGRLRKASIRRQIGTVLQRATVPPGTILNAILGTSGASPAIAWEAAASAGIADDIKALPMKMQTMISPGSPVFSTGQLQRIVIAQAIVSNPKIVLLDEATSALDNTTQAGVADALGRLQATRVVVAHRLSTIRDADRIYVLDRGRIVQVGTYEGLMAEQGVFANLVARQQLDDKLAMG